MSDMGYGELRRELDAMRRVVDAAVTWWRCHRPLVYREAEHLANPAINTTTDAERDLALAVAEYVAARKRDTDER